MKTGDCPDSGEPYEWSGIGQTYDSFHQTSNKNDSTWYMYVFLNLSCGHRVFGNIVNLERVFFEVLNGRFCETIKVTDTRLPYCSLVKPVFILQYQWTWWIVRRLKYIIFPISVVKLRPIPSARHRILLSSAWASVQSRIPMPNAWTWNILRQQSVSLYPYFFRKSPIPRS